MPKQKTHKTAAKRLKVTANGKVKRKKGGKHHLNGKKRTKRKRQLRKAAIEEGRRAKEWKRMLNT